MPRPSLRIAVRLPLAIGCFGIAGLCPLPGRAENEILLDDRIVPAQFQQRKTRATSSPPAAVDEDDVQYHGLTIVRPGTSASAVKKQALAELKLDSLPVRSRLRVQSVLQGTSLYRRLPTIDFEVDRDVYAYFLEHPNMAVSSWRAMGISRFELAETQPRVYTADAGDGSKGTIEVLYSTPEDTLIFCEGEFTNPLLAKPIVARAAMRLRARFHTAAGGRLMATHHGDVFVEFPSQTVETVAKLISPISHSIADRNFKQLTFYAHMMTVAMSRQPGWVESIARRMEGISDGQRAEFLKLSAATYVAARQREAARSGQSLSLDDVLGPLRITRESVPSRSAAPAPLPRVAAQPVSTTTSK